MGSSQGLGGFRGTRRFEPVRRLGTGGMGEVYEVLDRESGSRVALKLLSALSPEALLRFKNEFRVLQDIRHPNLVCLHELSQENGLWFFTMEFVEGVDFLRHVRPATPKAESAAATAKVPIGQQGEAPAAADAAIPRAAPRFDEQRLRDALGQLVLGLRALHAAGKVHRDVKPSNILVTREGRVALLDFGLTVDVERDPWLTGAQQAIGTPAFMAPEQAAGGRVGVESDWYAVGTVLYVALTGHLPFDGTSEEILLAKQRREPLPPSALVTAIPADLEALCIDLLRLHPAARPTGDEVLRRLHVASSVEGAVEASPPSWTPFVGREQELALLEKAFADARHHQAVVMEVHGESGVGKSALVRRFTERIAVAQGAVVLTGRCYESEAVPFKAIDGIIDALTAYMAGLPREDAAALLPLRASLLAQVFPVLRRVPAIAGAPLSQQSAMDPQELRTRVFAALRELFVRLAERRPLVLVIDDLQWTDADSLALLGELLRSPEAPALLLVATVREVAGTPAPNLAALASDVRHLVLSRLPPEEARELAALLLQAHGGGHRLDPAAIATEGGGHPLFIDELVRHAATGGGQYSAPLLLEEALWKRIEALGESASRILELLAVADMPMSQAAIAQAAPMGKPEFSRQLAQLRSASLVHMTGVRGSDSLQCCHDRVRAAVMAHLDPDARQRCHRALALALEAADRADAEALARHWNGAGDRERAAHYATEAAAQAARALAFDRSAKLYRQAIELRAPNDPAAHRLEIELAGVLVNAGRGLEAAETYLAASEGAGAAEALDLQRRAAEQFLFSGHVDRGMEALRKVLAAIDMPLPSTPFGSLMSLLVSRARLRLRGIRYRERDPSQVAADELTRIDLCWTVAMSLSMIDHIRGADFQTRSTLLALRAGEPFRIARGLGTEMGFSAIEGGRGARRTAWLYARADALARQINQPYTTALLRAAAGVAAFLQGEWKRARDLCDEAKTFFDGRIVGAAWEFDTVELYGALARAYMGELKQLRGFVQTKVAEAAQRGDLYAVTSLRTGPGPFTLFAADEPEGVHEHAREALERWSQHGFHVQHFLAMFGQAQADLYQGDGAACARRVAECWPLMKSAQLLRVQVVSALTDEVRARAALMEATRDGADRRRLLKVVARSIRRLKRTRMPYTEAFVSLLGAGSSAVRGELEGTATLLARAEEQCQAADMLSHAAAARRRRGEVQGDAALVASADQQMKELGIVRPDRFTNMLAPGYRKP